MMKTFLIILLMCCAVYGFSQQRFDPNADRENFFRVGAKAGVNINKITGQSYKEGFDYNYLLGGFV